MFTTIKERKTQKRLMHSEERRGEERKKQTLGHYLIDGIPYAIPYLLIIRLGLCGN